jgi:hypothetical protein
MSSKRNHLLSCGIFLAANTLSSSSQHRAYAGIAPADWTAMHVPASRATGRSVVQKRVSVNGSYATAICQKSSEAVTIPAATSSLLT